MNKHAFSRFVATSLLLFVALPPMTLQAQEAFIRIDFVEPSPLIPGQVFTIHGSGFTANGNIVTFNEGPYGEKKFFLQSEDGTTLSFQLPSYITPGEYQLTVRNQVGHQAVTSVTVGVKPAPTPRPTPTPTSSPTSSPTPTRPPTSSPGPTASPAPDEGVQINSIQPNPAHPNQEVTITGRGFTLHNNVVNIVGNGEDKKYFVAAQSESQITFRLSQFIDPGTYSVTVRNGHYQTSNATSLTVVGAPDDDGDSGDNDDDCFLIIFCPPGADDYAAFGDSMAAGTTAFRGYVARYRDFIREDTDITVDLDNFARPGWKSKDLADALRGNESFREGIRDAEFITWNIGGNDLREARDRYRIRDCGGFENQNCLQHTVEKFKDNWNAIIQEISSLKQNEAVFIRTLDIYNPYVDEDKKQDTWPGDGGNDFRILRPYLEEMNRHIHATSARAGIKVAPIYELYNGPNGGQDPDEKGYISFDNFHPNDAGHRVIAEALRQLGFAEAGNRPQASPQPLPSLTPLPTFVPSNKPPFTFTPPNPLPTITPRS